MSIDDLHRTTRNHLETGDRAYAGGSAGLADHLHDGVAVYDPDGHLRYWNAAATSITGWQRTTAEAAAFLDRASGLAEIRPGKWIESRRVRLEWDGSPAEAVLFNDVTSERRLRDTEQQLRDIGLIDPVTGLIGERLLRDHARRAVSLATRDGRSAGIIWLALDRFTGSGTGANVVADEVMRQSARRIETAVRTSDVVARPDAGSIVVMLTALTTSADLQFVAVRLLLVLAPPCLVEGRERSVAVRAGGAVFPLHGNGSDALIDAARNAAAQSAVTGGQLVMAQASEGIAVGA